MLQQEISLEALSPERHVTIERDDDVNMEGYLFKRTSNAFKSWVRYVIVHQILGKHLKIVCRPCLGGKVGFIIVPRHLFLSIRH